MELTVLGKYGPFPPAGGRTSGYLLKIGGKKILLDCGEGVFSALRAFLSPEDLDFVVLSHFHYDHACDLGVLHYYLENRGRRGTVGKPVLFCPSDDSPFARSLSALSTFRAVAVTDGFSCEEEGISFSFFRMRHPVPTFGVRICSGGQTFAYSGDTNVTDTLIPLLEGASFALLDGAFLPRDKGENKPHMSVDDCGRLARKCAVKSVISHFISDYDEAEVLAEIKRQGCIPAEEGKTYRV